MAAGCAPPLLVQVLGGNGVTGAAVLLCLDARDTPALRRLHPAVALAVAEVPWGDSGARVSNVALWRAALPRAVGAKVAALPRGTPSAAAAPLAGMLHLDLADCPGVTDELIACLPPTLHTLVVARCTGLTAAARFVHLPALASLDCSGTPAVSAGVGNLPPSLHTLRADYCSLPPTTDFGHLRALRLLSRDVAKCALSSLSAATISTLPPLLEELSLSARWRTRGSTWDHAASFAHLPRLTALNVSGTPIRHATIATLPPSLVSLNASTCGWLKTPSLPSLPALQKLNMSGTGICDTTIASMPPSLVELRITDCFSVTSAAVWDHLGGLRVLQASGTEVARAVVWQFDQRGVYAPADGVCGTLDEDCYQRLALLPDGRLAALHGAGGVTAWDLNDYNNTMEVNLDIPNVTAFAVLPNTGRAVVAMCYLRGGMLLVMEDITSPFPPGWSDVGPVVEWGYTWAVAVAELHDGSIAVGFDTKGSSNLLVLNAEQGAFVAELRQHTDSVNALVVLADGTLASGSSDTTVCLWDVTNVDDPCVATLTGHAGAVRALAALDGNQLASGADDCTVRLWDAVSRVCVGVLEGHTGGVTALARLHDNRLASGSADCTIRVWDTCRAAHDKLACVMEGHTNTVTSLQALPRGRLASASGDSTIRFWLPPRSSPPA